jgi:hypothetical protein
MDLANLPAPVFTAVDGVTQGTAAFVYVAIGIAGWLRGPPETSALVSFSHFRWRTLSSSVFRRSGGFAD